MPLLVLHGAPPMGHHEPEKTKICHTAKTSLWFAVAPQKFKDIVSGINQSKQGPDNTFQARIKKVGHGATLSYKKSSARDVKRKGRIEDVSLLFNAHPANFRALYVYHAASQAIIHKISDFTNLTGKFESNGDSSWIIRILNEEKIIIPTFFTKRIVLPLLVEHCVSSFVYG